MTVTKNIDLAIFRENLAIAIREMSPAKVMAVVKADAYGHGLIQCASAAIEAGVEMLGVLDIETGLSLRNAGIEAPAFAWLHSPESNFLAAVRANLDLSVSSLEELESIAAVEGIAKLHLKIDTGLSRNGCRIENWPALVQKALELQRDGRVTVVALWSHLSGTSIAADEESLEAFERASEIAAGLGFKGYRHVAASPAAFGLPKSRFDMVRIGVAAFGTSPISGKKSSELALRSPMTLTAEVLSPGVISIGFLHGYFSSLAGKAKVTVNGQEFLVSKIGPLASRIEEGGYEIGDKVTVFADEATGATTAEELCELAATVTDELFTGIKANLITYSS